MKAALERHLFLSDFQIPDHNVQALEAVYKFIPEFKADKLHIVGDFLNFTKISRFDTDPLYKVSLSDEISAGREVLYDLEYRVRKANRNCEVTWYEGNHEYRLMKYLARQADQLAELNIDGNHVISVPYLFELSKHNIKWCPYYETRMIRPEIEVEHGMVVRQKGGYTAHAQLDRRGYSGFSGHTHRLAMVMKTQSGRKRFWVETGSLCNLQPTPPYALSPDWQNGFAVAYWDHKSKTFYPEIVPILDNTFQYGGRIYK